MLVSVVARIIGLSSLTSGLGAGLGLVLFGKDPSSNYFPAFSLAYVGAIIGAIAGAAGEIVAAQRQKLGW
jgi:hypothetical protein